MTDCYSNRLKQFLRIVRDTKFYISIDRYNIFIILLVDNGKVVALYDESIGEYLNVIPRHTPEEYAIEHGSVELRELNKDQALFYMLILSGEIPELVVPSNKDPLTTPVDRTPWYE